MVAALSNGDDRDLVQKIFSRYLNTERKYDAWGAQGKLLVLREILCEEGFDIQQLASIGVRFQKLVNLVFPRMFFLHNKKEYLPNISKGVIEYYIDVKFQLWSHGLEESMLQPIAFEETSVKFAIDAGQVKDILKLEINNQTDMHWDARN